EPALDGLYDAVGLVGEEVGLEAGGEFEGSQFGGGIVAVGGEGGGSKLKAQSSRKDPNQKLQIPTGTRKPPEARDLGPSGRLRLRIAVASRTGPSRVMRAGGAQESSRWEAPRERSA